jgi:hypothetical protein
LHEAGHAPSGIVQDLFRRGNGVVDIAAPMPVSDGEGAITVLGLVGRYVLSALAS